MPGTDREAERPGNRNARERVLKAAIGLFARKGYSGASVREIVETAGVTKPVLYYYFANKEGLFRAILDDAQKRHEKVVARVLKSEGSTGVRLKSFFSELLEALRVHSDLFKLMYSLALGPSNDAPRYDIEKFINQTTNAIRMICEEGRRRGEPVHVGAEAVSVLFLSLLSFVILSHSPARTPFRKIDDSLILEAFGLAFGGLMKKEEA